jgi:hypothetical protein
VRFLLVKSQFTRVPQFFRCQNIFAGTSTCIPVEVNDVLYKEYLVPGTVVHILPYILGTAQFIINIILYI